VFNMVWPFAMKGLPIEYC